MRDLTDQAAMPNATCITIETPRLRLRAHRADDLAALVALAGDWAVASWMTNLPHPYTEAHGRDRIARVQEAHARGEPRAFAVALRETDELIGGAGLDGSSGDDTGEASLGFWVGRPYWGQGYAREAVGAVISHGFQTLRLPAIRAVTDPDNLASQKVLLACGLSRFGDIDLVKPMRRGARRAPLFRILRG